MTIEQTIRLGAQYSLDELLTRATDALRTRIEAMKLLEILEQEEEELRTQAQAKGAAQDRQSAEDRLNAAHMSGGGQIKARTRTRRLATVQFDELSNMTTVKLHQLNYWIKKIKDTKVYNSSFKKEEEERVASPPALRE